jgi:hypothetical protein
VARNLKKPEMDSNSPYLICSIMWDCSLVLKRGKIKNEEVPFS